MTQNHAHDVSPEEAQIAGVEAKDDAAMEALRRKLVEWDYTVPASATTAYKIPNVERLQFLRQIKGELHALRKIKGTKNHWVLQHCMIDYIMRQKVVITGFPLTRHGNRQQMKKENFSLGLQ